MPLTLAQPAASQEAQPDAAPSPDLIDPDCPDPRREVHPSLLEKPDGICLPEDLLSRPPRPQPGPGPAERPPQSPEAVGNDAPRPVGPDIGPGGPAGPRPQSGPQRPAGKPGKDRPRRKRRRGARSDEPNGGTRAEPRRNRSADRRPRRRAKPGRARETKGDGGGAGGGFAQSLPGPGLPEIIERGTRVPRFLQSIYHSAGARYGIRWEVLAAINEIETDFGANLNVSWAGATGWMQFMPATWRAYGTDGDRDGKKDPYEPADAIFSAARYLKAAGYAYDVRAALFAYNHATWYVEDVLKRARSIAADYLSPSRARLLDPRFAARLERVAERHRLPWELMLAVLRARGRGGEVPATRAELRALARRLVRLGARKNPRRALRRLARTRYVYAQLRPRLLSHEPTFVERVVALAHYNKAVGLEGLEHGLKHVRARLAERVLASRRLEIYPGGRSDIEAGVTSARVLALLAYLASRYEQVGVTSLTSGHGFFTASGNVSAHSYGRAVDVASLNGTPILGNQEAGGLTERALWNVLLAPDELAPSELISLIDLGGPSFALDDHADHIHVGY